MSEVRNQVVKPANPAEASGAGLSNQAFDDRPVWGLLASNVVLVLGGIWLASTVPYLDRLTVIQLGFYVPSILLWSQVAVIGVVMQVLPKPVAVQSEVQAEVEEAYSSQQDAAQSSSDGDALVWQPPAASSWQVNQADLHDRHFPTPVQNKLRELEARAAANAEAQEILSVR